MELAFPQDLSNFRHEVRQFLSQALPPEIAWRSLQGFHPSPEDLKEWNRILGEKGWAAPDWPKEHGGPGWNPLQSYVFEDECAAVGAPHIQWRAGISLVGPVIYTFGSEALRKRYLPKILTGDEWWCQGFSEPGSGSDLASLRTTARLDGETFVVRGHKIWTSEADYSDLMFCLARTEMEVKPQRGLSCLVLDMHAPGVTVRPIETIDNSVTINEVFLDDVRVPLANLIGERGQGWTYAKFLLANERHSNALIQRTKQDLARFRNLLKSSQPDGWRLLDDPVWRNRLAEMEIEVMGVEMAVLRAMCDHAGSQSGDSRSMAFTSALKLRGAELQQRVADSVLSVLGPQALPLYSDQGPAPEAPFPDAGIAGSGATTRAMFRRAATIYAGANEIQRGIIWQQVFEKGLQL
jgi:alkylation response protein AidB-like acyl-CoA dehydrogenase